MIESWIPIFGVPARITTDRGAQFPSALFGQLSRLLGCTHIKSTAYHPAASGLVERFHRQLKSSLMATSPSRLDWSERLPIILLAFRTTVKEDLGFSPAELVFGTTLRLPSLLREHPERKHQIINLVLLSSRNISSQFIPNHPAQLMEHLKSTRI